MTRPAANLLIVFVLLSALAEPAPVGVPAQVSKEAPHLTAERLREKGWWPTKTDADRKDYAGSESCMECHREIVREQRGTRMADAAWRASDTEVLRSNPTIALSTPPFQTVITNDRAVSNYAVTRGRDSMSGQILWSMGDGVIGETFILQSGGSLFESQLTYYSSIRGLDTTPGHPTGAPKDLEHAFGERQSTETSQRCFACHTTASSVRRHFDPAGATPGVTCEACHGPGALHVKAMQAKQFQKGQDAILDPGLFEPVKLVDFCGACHRAPLDVAAEKDYLPINIRFQPYRLSKSRCWSQPDPRISCIACHNPHELLVRDINFYDDKCLACHAAKTANASPSSQAQLSTRKSPACPVGTRQCVSCHMPNYKVPQMHASFTDHDIRVVRPGAPYPL
jgi:hypothetical protein